MGDFGRERKGSLNSSEFVEDQLQLADMPLQAQLPRLWAPDSEVEKYAPKASSIRGVIGPQLVYHTGELDLWICSNGPETCHDPRRGAEVD